MRKNKGFTLLEIIIALIIIGALVTTALVSYKSVVEKSKSAEAVINAGTIRQAEETQKLDKGAYVAAESTQEINERLGLDIKPKYYEYKVVGVTDDDFIVIAQRIGEEIKAGELSSASTILAMNKSGVVSSGYGGYLGTGGTGTAGGIGGAGTGSTGGLGGISGGSGGTGGSSGGTSGTGSSGGGSSGGGGSTTPVYNTELADALNVLKSSQVGIYFYNLIQEKNISVVYENLNSLGTNVAGLYVPTWWFHLYPQGSLPGKTPNTFYVDISLKTKWSATAVATVLIHELTHADYNHNTEKWVAETTARLSVGRDDLNWAWDAVDSQMVLLDSQDQEYNAFKQAVLLWDEMHGSEVNNELDDLLAKYNQDKEGGSVLKQEVVSRYAKYEPYNIIEE